MNGETFSLVWLKEAKRIKMIDHGINIYHFTHNYFKQKLNKGENVNCYPNMCPKKNQLTLDSFPSPNPSKFGQD